MISLFAMQQFLTKQWLTYRLPMDTLSILNAKKVSRIDILRWLHTVAVRADVVILTARFTGEAGCMKECIHSSAAALSSLYSESASVTHTCGKECNRMRWVLWGDGTWWVLWGDGTQWVLWGDGTWWVRNFGLSQQPHPFRVEVHPWSYLLHGCKP